MGRATCEDVCGRGCSWSGGGEGFAGLGAQSQHDHQVGAAGVLMDEGGRLTPGAQAVLHQRHHLIHSPNLPAGEKGKLH